MAWVTGTLADVTYGKMIGKNPEIIFQINGPAQTDSGGLYVTDPIHVAPLADGSWSVNLVATERMRHRNWYTISIRWMDAQNNYVQIDFPDWKFFVPEAGGNLVDLAGAPPTNGRLVYVSLEPPEVAQPFMFWLVMDPQNPDSPESTGELLEWRND